MDMVMSIASAAMSMNAARFMTDMNFALMGKVLDTAEFQGEALQGMIEAASPSLYALDVYA